MSDVMNQGEIKSIQVTKAGVFVLFFARFAFGVMLLQAGLTKIFDPEWSAAGYLMYGINEKNPFIQTWQSMAGNPVVDLLNSWGVLLIGIGITLGILTRWCLFWSGVMFFLLWLANWRGTIAEGIPVEFGWVLEEHILYVLCVITVFWVIGIGRFIGFGAVLEKRYVTSGSKWMSYLLG